MFWKYWDQPFPRTWMKRFYRSAEESLTVHLIFYLRKLFMVRLSSSHSSLSLSPQSDFMQEANMVMAKLNYVEGDYKESLRIYAWVGLEDMELVAAPPYKLRMIAEAFSTKGIVIVREDLDNLPLFHIRPTTRGQHLSIL